MPAVCRAAVGGFAVFRGLGHANSLEPVCRVAEGVAVVVEQGVLGREAIGALIELLGAAAGGAEGLQQRRLAGAVDGGRRICDGGGEVVAEAGVVVFAAAAGGGDDHAVRGAGELLEE